MWETQRVCTLLHRLDADPTYVCETVQSRDSIDVTMSHDHDGLSAVSHSGANDCRPDAHRRWSVDVHEMRPRVGRPPAGASRRVRPVRRKPPVTVEHLPARVTPRVTGQNLIPGAYQRRPVTPRRAGAMSGPAYGSADMPVGLPTMSAATIAERRKEGGGRA